MGSEALHQSLEELRRRIAAGEGLDPTTAIELARHTQPTDLYGVADRLRREIHGQAIDLCSIVNARAGKCSEDCRFCAQSKHHCTEVETYDVVEADKALSLAQENERYGVERFSLVTAGKTVSSRDLDAFSKIYDELRRQTNLGLCASMGFLTPAKARRLKEMGVTRYHCNLETARSYFPQVCSTHSWEDKVATIKIAREAGLEICSGGIIGMGETLEQRLELAFQLRDLGVLSIPLNILTPIANTPFADLKPLTADEVLVAVAMFRLINPLAVVRIAGGRNLLGDRQYLCFSSGANGAIVGNYLTTIGTGLAEDIATFQALGFTIPAKFRKQ